MVRGDKCNCSIACVKVIKCEGWGNSDEEHRGYTLLNFLGNDTIVNEGLVEFASEKRKTGVIRGKVTHLHKRAHYSRNSKLLFTSIENKFLL